MHVLLGGGGDNDDLPSAAACGVPFTSTDLRRLLFALPPPLVLLLLLLLWRPCSPCTLASFSYSDLQPLPFSSKPLTPIPHTQNSQPLILYSVGAPCGAQEPELTWLCLDCSEPGVLGEGVYDFCIDKVGWV